jgi:hypothetical protein
MSYDYARLFENLIASVTSGGEISVRMSSVISECARQKPHADWDRLKSIDFQADAKAIAGWLNSAFASTEVQRDYAGLWFGLFNPVRQGKPSADAYVCAAPEFDRKSIEWTDNINKPHQGCYLSSQVLNEVYAIAYESKQGLKNDAEYPLVLAYGAMVAHDLLSRNILPEPLARLRGAAIGFDSGDFLVLGEFSKRGFVPNVEAG